MSLSVVVSTPFTNLLALTRLVDTQPLLELFTAAAQNNTTAMSNAANRITHENPTFSIPYQAVAAYAATCQSGDALRLCLSNGASLHNEFTPGRINPQNCSYSMLDVLYDYDWRGLRTTDKWWNIMTLSPLGGPPGQLLWLLDHGLVIDSEIINHSMDETPAPAATIAALFQRNPETIELFKQSGFLQNAARQGNADVVKLLLERGLDPHEDVDAPEPDMREPDISMPLYEAVDRKCLDTIMVLLSFGADPDRKSTGRRQTPRQLAEEKNYRNILPLFEEDIIKDLRKDLCELQI